MTCISGDSSGEGDGGSLSRVFLTAILILEVSYRTNPFDLSPLKKNPAKSPTRYIRNTLGNVFTKWGVGGWVGGWESYYSGIHLYLSVTLFLEQHFLLQVPDYTPTPTQFSMSQIFSRRPHGPARYFTASKTCFPAWSVAWMKKHHPRLATLVLLYSWIYGN